MICRLLSAVVMACTQAGTQEEVLQIERRIFGYQTHQIKSDLQATGKVTRDNTLTLHMSERENLIQVSNINYFLVLKMLSAFNVCPREQFDLGPYCLQYRLPKNISRRKEQTTNVVTVLLRFNNSK